MARHSFLIKVSYNEYDCGTKVSCLVLHCPYNPVAPCQPLCSDCLDKAILAKPQSVRTRIIEKVLYDLVENDGKRLPLRTYMIGVDNYYINVCDVPTCKHTGMIIVSKTNKLPIINGKNCCKSCLVSTVSKLSDSVVVEN